jgi:hypothetical protein
MAFWLWGAGIAFLGPDDPGIYCVVWDIDAGASETAKKMAQEETMSDELNPKRARMDLLTQLTLKRLMEEFSVLGTGFD